MFIGQAKAQRVFKPKFPSDTLKIWQNIDSLIFLVPHGKNPLELYVQGNELKKITVDSDTLNIGTNQFLILSYYKNGRLKSTNFIVNNEYEGY